jgi:signal transduction histidine kinase
MESVIKVAGGLAHEMNNVLSGVGSSLELLERRLAQGPARALGQLRAGGPRMRPAGHRPDQNLLAFARSQPLSPNPLDINQLIREAQPMLEQCVGAEMHLRWELDIAPWPVQLGPRPTAQRHAAPVCQRPTLALAVAPVDPYQQ